MNRDDAHTYANAPDDPALSLEDYLATVEKLKAEAPPQGRVVLTRRVPFGQLKQVDRPDPRGRGPGVRTFLLHPLSWETFVLPYVEERTVAQPVWGVALSVTVWGLPVIEDEALAEELLGHDI